LTFTSIVDNPRCQIRLEEQILYTGSVLPSIDFDLAQSLGPVSLTISHIDKRPEDTVVIDGKIVRDRSFELASIIVDGYDIEELKWQSQFRSVDGNVYDSCLFFGPNGDFHIVFELPILKWILRCRHEKNNDDPHWEDDYQSYTNACIILDQISQK
jgi:hypothetical protein